MTVTYYKFCKTIASDFNIELNQKHKMYFDQFKIVNGKRKITACFDSVIVDRNGIEYPYMLDCNKRNEDKLVDFDYIYVIRPKSLNDILSEANITLKSQRCKICEGGGWYSNGTRYFYKDLECEV